MPHEKLKQGASNAYRQADRLTRENKLQYYLLISQGLHEYGCDDPVEALIMGCIAEGKLVKDISATLKFMGERCHRNTIMWIRKKYENRWGIRKWRPDQLKSKRMPYKRRATK